MSGFWFQPVCAGTDTVQHGLETVKPVNPSLSVLASSPATSGGNSERGQGHHDLAATPLAPLPPGRCAGAAVRSSLCLLPCIALSLPKPRSSTRPTSPGRAPPVVPQAMCPTCLADQGCCSGSRSRACQVRLQQGAVCRYPCHRRRRRPRDARCELAVALLCCSRRICPRCFSHASGRTRATHPARAGRPCPPTASRMPTLHCAGASPPARAGRTGPSQLAQASREPAAAPLQCCMTWLERIREAAFHAAAN